MSLELRESANGRVVLRGLASRTDVWYPIGRDQQELIRPGAFGRTLAEGPDVCLRIEHSALPLARSTSKTGTPSLELSEGSEGLHFTASLNLADPDVQSLRAKAENVDLQCSFAFRCNADSWDDRMERREVHEVNLHKGDVSIVAYGANEQTSVAISERGASTLEERRACADRLAGRVAGPGALLLRSDYSTAELEHLGGEGKAFLNPDGHYSYPTKTPNDLAKAIHAVGRSPAPLHDKIRHYLIHRATEMNLSHLIPSNWSAEGHLMDRAAASETECPRCNGTGEITIRCPDCSTNVESDGEPITPIQSINGRSAVWTLVERNRRQERLLFDPLVSNAQRTLERRILHAHQTGEQMIADPLDSARRFLAERR